MPFCLPKHIIDDFIAAIKAGKIDPVKMMDMSSEQRRELLAQFIGEDNAQKANAAYEAKLLLKDQQRGMITWIKQTGGITPKAERDIIARVNKMEEALNPKNEDAFLEDLVAQKLGVTVTMEEAANISELARVATDKKEVMEGLPRRINLGRPTQTELDYGRSAIAFRNYISEIKLEAGKVTLEDFKADPIGFLKTNALRAAGIAKSLKATLDNSALFRQGWKVMLTNPKIWAKQAKGSFVNMYNSFKGRNVMDEINAEIVSNPNYDNMIKDRLAITVIEEEFPETELLQKIPFFGTLQKASEDAFTGFAYKNRADLYDYYTDIAKKSGIVKTTGIGIGKLANSLGSRGALGRLEPIADVLNVVFFSARNLKANLDVLTGHILDKEVRQSKFARKQAAINTLRIISGTGAILAIASAMGADVEDDPTSADFGKIKVGNTRFDVTGGMGSIAVLAMRLIRGEVKSTTTGKVTKIRSEEFTLRTADEVIYDFFANKYSPALSVARNLLRGRTFKGEKPTIPNTIRDLAVPISIETFFELLKDPESADVVLSMVAEALGIGTQTYSGTKKAVGLGG